MVVLSTVRGKMRESSKGFVVELLCDWLGKVSQVFIQIEGRARTEATDVVLEHSKGFQFSANGPSDGSCTIKVRFAPDGAITVLSIVGLVVDESKPDDNHLENYFEFRVMDIMQNAHAFRKAILVWVGQQSAADQEIN